MPAARYQHGAVFVGARLHISGGAVGGGRMVDDPSSIVVLDTAAGTWCTQARGCPSTYQCYISQTILASPPPSTLHV